MIATTASMKNIDHDSWLESAETEAPDIKSTRRQQRRQPPSLTPMAPAPVPGHHRRRCGQTSRTVVGLHPRRAAQIHSRTRARDSQAAMLDLCAKVVLTGAGAASRSGRWSLPRIVGIGGTPTRIQPRVHSHLPCSIFLLPSSRLT
jgi:hypothetical protein